MHRVNLRKRAPLGSDVASSTRPYLAAAQYVAASRKSRGRAKPVPAAPVTNLPVYGTTSHPSTVPEEEPPQVAAPGQVHAPAAEQPLLAAPGQAESPIGLELNGQQPSSVPQTDQMEDLCGKTVGESSTAGKLSFDFSQPRLTTCSECSLTVRPNLTARRDGSTSKVMFYFTEFELESFCTENNLTLGDAYSIVPGTQKEMCGKNDTLLKSFFSTYLDHFRVVFRWNKYGARFRNAKFTLKYISYYDGPCVDDGQSRKCGLSERCVPAEFYCSLGEDLHECGYTDEAECQFSKVEELTWWGSLLNQMKNVGIVIAVVIAVYFVFRLLRTLQNHGFFKNCETIDKMLASTSRRSRRSETGTTAAATDASRNALTVDNVSRRNSSASSISSEENGYQSIEQSHLIIRNDIVLNSDCTGPNRNFLTPPERSAPLPSVAPPSYDEVMRSPHLRSMKDKYPPPPYCA